MEFVKIEKGRYLSVKNMEDIYNNFIAIKDLLTQKGYSTDKITIYDNRVSYTIHPLDIVYHMQAVEDSIKEIHELLDFEDSFYKYVIWWESGSKNLVVDKKKEVHRWIDWQNNIYNILARPGAGYAALIDINGNYITDINGAQIYVQKEQ